MRKAIVLLCVVVLSLVAMAGWQFGACLLAYIELGDDMQDMSSQLGSRIGFIEPMSDEGFRQAVLQHAQKYGIELTPDQIMVRRTGPEDKQLYLAADYTRRVHLPGMTFTLHFAPHAGTK